MFVASDIAKILEYRDAEKLARNLDDDEKGTHEVGTLRGVQNMTVLTESGLYHAILNRPKPYSSGKRRNCSRTPVRQSARRNCENGSADTIGHTVTPEHGGQPQNA